MKLLAAIVWGSLHVHALFDADCCNPGSATCNEEIRGCVSEFDSFCQDTWDSQCIEEAKERCALVCTKECSCEQLHELAEEVEDAFNLMLESPRSERDYSTLNQFFFA